MKVSIYCLVYNHAKYLRDALEGFIRQKTTFEYEVIVHDDASTDASAEIIREYALKYPDRIKPIYQKENQYSQGVEIVQEYIIPKLQGEYIASCEGDDYWTDETKLQQQVEFLDSHRDYVACVHNTIKMDLWQGKSEPMYHQESDCDLTFADVVAGGSSCYHTSALMYRKSVRENLPQYMMNNRSFGDYQLAIYLATVGKIRYINQPMSVYRFGIKESFTRRTGRSIESMISVYTEIVQLLSEVDAETEGKYTNQIQPIKRMNQYYLAEAKGEYRSLRVEPLKSIYATRSVKYRVKTYLLQYSGPIGKAYLKYKRKALYR